MREGDSLKDQTQKITDANRSKIVEVTFPMCLFRDKGGSKYKPLGRIGRLVKTVVEEN